MEPHYVPQRVGYAFVRFDLPANRQSSVKYLLSLVKPLTVQIAFTHPSKDPRQLSAGAKALESWQILLAERHHADEVGFPAADQKAVNQHVRNQCVISAGGIAF